MFSRYICENAQSEFKLLFIGWSLYYRQHLPDGTDKNVLFIVQRQIVNFESAFIKRFQRLRTKIIKPKRKQPQENFVPQTSDKSRKEVA